MEEFDLLMIYVPAMHHLFESEHELMIIEYCQKKAVSVIIARLLDILKTQTSHLPIH